MRRCHISGFSAHVKTTPTRTKIEHAMHLLLNDKLLQPFQLVTSKIWMIFEHECLRFDTKTLPNPYFSRLFKKISWSIEP